MQFMRFKRGGRGGSGTSVLTMLALEGLELQFEMPVSRVICIASKTVPAVLISKLVYITNSLDIE